jgi:hypothetical protein
MSDDVLGKVVQEMLETLKQVEEKPVKKWGMLTNIGLG